ncbi:MAG: YybH family protein [Gemmatimonadota bacterium]
MRAMRRRAAGLVLVVLLPAALAGCRFEMGEEEDLERSIEAMLHGSADAWNRGDLDGFVASYADGASTSLMTDEGPVVGRETIRGLYAPRFEPGATRDTLRFEDLDVRPLPPLIGIVTGRYVFERGGTVAESGWFSVVVRRAGDGWRIVHGHSS